MLTGHSAEAGNDAASRRLANFRHVLEAAAQTDYYRTHLKAARLVGPDALNQLRSVEEALRSLPVLEGESLIAEPSRFRSRLIRPGNRRPDAGLRWLWNRKRDSIAGPISSLRCLAVEVMTGRAPIPVGARRLVVQTCLIETALSDRDRDLLWQAFELPVFEELRGLDGELLASECEAHAGMHPEPESVLLEPAIARSGLLLTSLAATLYPTLRLHVPLHSVPTPFGCDCGCRAELLQWFQALPARKPVRMGRGSALRSMAGAG